MRILYSSAALVLLCSAAFAAPPTPKQLQDQTQHSWELDDERQTACKLYDQALLACVQQNECNQTIIDALKRRCSAFR